VEVDGKLNSSSFITLSRKVLVKGKINSSAKITLSDGVEVEEKLDASGAIELKNGVRVSQSHRSLLGLDIDHVARLVARLMLVEP
jgi:predicted acyltransferase (DUF342 family)